MKWIKEHVAVVAAWLGMVATLLVSVGSHWTLLQVEHEVTAAKIAVIDKKVEGHEDALTLIRGDVRSLAESQQRAIEVIERTDEGLRALEQVTAELRAITAAQKGSK
jgi:hypothetical protein